MEQNCLEVEKIKLQFKIWKTAVETQMHFNDLIVKIRQLCFSIIAALVATVLYLTRENVNNTITHSHLPFWLTLLIISLLIFLWWMERCTILPLLRGAVKFGENLEKNVLCKNITYTHQGMTELISIYSKYTSVDSVELTNTDNNTIGFKYIGSGKKTSLRKKIDIAYGFIIGLLCIGAAFLWHI
ncbi:hypothetical protein [Legionella gresilensis]|uniref:hypothetical protein n=1 Tax=Legionella gresilensis TaxID=91823 RepID=UPI0010414AD1|nr:hypothetical protein [Legionella gresilensis]